LGPQAGVRMLPIWVCGFPAFFGELESLLGLNNGWIIPWWVFGVQKEQEKTWWSTFFGFIHPGTLRKHETSSGTVLLRRQLLTFTWEDYLFANWSYLARSGSPIRFSIQWDRGLFNAWCWNFVFEHETSSIGNWESLLFWVKGWSHLREVWEKEPKLLAKPPWVIDSFH